VAKGLLVRIGSSKLLQHTMQGLAPTSRQNTQSILNSPSNHGNAAVLNVCCLLCSPELHRANSRAGLLGTCTGRTRQTKQQQVTR